MQVVTVSATTLLQVAAQYLGDPSAWGVIATLNGLRDPWIDGLTTLRLPPAPETSRG